MPLDAETLASLRTPSGKYCTAAFGGHAGTKAVAHGALALVGLIGPLHLNNPLSVQIE